MTTPFLDEVHHDRPEELAEQTRELVEVAGDEVVEPGAHLRALARHEGRARLHAVHQVGRQQCVARDSLRGVGEDAQLRQIAMPQPLGDSGQQRGRLGHEGAVDEEVVFSDERGRVLGGGELLVVLGRMKPTCRR